MSDDIPEVDEDWFKRARLVMPNEKKITEEMTTDEALLIDLRHDVCPDCGAKGLLPGPRGGVGQNLICDKCGHWFNVAYPRYIIMAQRVR